MLKGSVDVCIMAHPSRTENVKIICNTLDLSDDSVFWDDREDGGDAMYTARKAWQSPIPEKSTHRLVLQDDIVICDNFLTIVNRVASTHKDSIVTLFHCDKHDTASRYIPTKRIRGCAIMIPVKMLEDLWWFVDNRMEFYRKPQLEEILKRDTSCIQVWSSAKRIPCYTTVPSLVQHIGDESLVGLTKKRVAPDFTMNPPLTGW